MEALSFLRQFLLRPGQIGAVLPSSPQLAEEMVSGFDWDAVRAVSEYGPGTGPFTGLIQSRKHPDAKFFCVELEAGFTALLRRKFPGLTVHQRDVRDIRQILAEEGLEHLDAILCGLPWASFPARLQHEILETLAGALRPGGQFATFAYLPGLLLPAAWRFRRVLGQHFPGFTTSRIVWRNFPPAFVYRCRKAPR